jgi:hypothetical protein
MIFFNEWKREKQFYERHIYLGRILLPHSGGLSFLAALDSVSLTF